MSFCRLGDLNQFVPMPVAGMRLMRGDGAEEDGLIVAAVLNASDTTSDVVIVDEEHVPALSDGGLHAPRCVACLHASPCVVYTTHGDTQGCMHVPFCHGCAKAGEQHSNRNPHAAESPIMGSRFKCPICWVVGVMQTVFIS